MIFQSYPSLYVANYFLTLACPDVEDFITNLKLQKLCYYAKGFSLAVRPEGSPALFDDVLVAWTHGPVSQALYRAFKQYGGTFIPCDDIELDFDVFANKDKKLMDDVYHIYGQYSAWKLRQMTHDEPPWKIAYGHGSGSSIDDAPLREYFLTQTDDDYIQDYLNFEEE